MKSPLLRAGKPLVVTTRTECDYLVDWLKHDDPALFSLDCETEGCDPNKQSPVYNARVWSIQLAWWSPSENNKLGCAMVLASAVTTRLVEWLERHPCVGSGILSFDRHAVFNSPFRIRLRVVADTWNMSKLLDPSQNAGHGLKQWAERLGYKPLRYSDVAGVCMGGKTKLYKKDRENLGKHCSVQFVAGCEFTTLRITADRGKDTYKRGVTTLRDIWENYPQRRERVVRYCVDDAIHSYAVWSHLKKELSRRLAL